MPCVTLDVRRLVMLYVRPRVFMQLCVMLCVKLRIILFDRLHVMLCVRLRVVLSDLVSCRVSYCFVKAHIMLCVIHMKACVSDSVGLIV